MKIFIKIFLVIAVVAICFFASIPYLLNTSWGSSLLQNSLSSSLDGKVSIKKLKLSWLGPQEIEGFSFACKNNTSSLSWEMFSSKNSLFSFIFNGMRFNSAKLVNPKAYYVIGPSKAKGLMIPTKHLEIIDGLIALKTPKSDIINIKDIGATLTINAKFDEIDLKVFAKSSYMGKSGLIDFLLKTKPQTSPIPSFQCIANINKFPVEAIDELFTFYEPNFFTKAIGAELSLKLKAFSNSETLSLFADVDSSYLTGKVDTADSDPGSLKWLVNPEVAKAFLPKAYSLNQAAIIHFNLDKFSVPFIDKKPDLLNMATQMRFSSEKLDVSLNNHAFACDNLSIILASQTLKKAISIRASSKISYLEVTAPIVSTIDIENPFDKRFIKANVDIQKGFYQSGSFKAQINASLDSSNIFYIDTSVLASFSKNKALYHLLGSKQSFKLSGNGALDNHSLYLEKIDLQTNGEKLVCSTKMQSYKNFSKTSLIAPIKGSYLLTNDGLKILVPSLDKDLSLKQNAHLTFSIDPFSLSSSKSFSFPSLSGSVQSDAIHLVQLEGKVALPLTKAHAHFLYDHKQLDIKSTAEFTSPDHPSSLIKADITIFDYELGSQDVLSRYRIDFYGQDFPSRMLGVWFGKGMLMPPIFGETVNANFTINQSNISEVSFDLSSNLMQTNGAFSLGKELQIKPKAPLQIHWQATPLGYKAATRLFNDEIKQEHFIIKKPFIFKALIDRFTIDKQFELPSFSSLDIKGEFEIKDLEIANLQNTLEANIESLSCYVAKKPKDALSYDCNAKISSGSIDAYGNIYLPSHKNIDALEFTNSVHINNLPTITLDLFASALNLTKIPPSWIFGPTFNGSLESEVKNKSGKLDLQLNTSTCKTSVNGAIINGKLMLMQPIEAILYWSEDLDRLFLNQASLHVIRAKQPIRLTIDPKGFILPISGFSLSNLQVPNMKLDFGQIVFYDKGNVTNVNEIFKLRSQTGTELWFAPFYMHLQRGILQIERTEILYDNRYHICTWGTVNLNKRYVSMILGLTAQSLRAALGISGLPENYVLKVPFKGPFGDVQIDKASAIAKVGLLIARTQDLSQFGAVGGFLNIVGRALDDQSDVPAPKKPYPWGNRISYIDVRKELSRTCRKQRVRKTPKEVATYSLPAENFVIP